MPNTLNKLFTSAESKKPYAFGVRLPSESPWEFSVPSDRPAHTFYPAILKALFIYKRTEPETSNAGTQAGGLRERGYSKSPFLFANELSQRQVTQTHRPEACVRGALYFQLLAFILYTVHLISYTVPGTQAGDLREGS
ncbi:MAG TPA: hypothetical protein PKE30_06415 [Niabella sp.]|nr:hypothetical protein [Niabella sp.]